MEKNRRHIILINKNFQFMLISKFIAVNIIIMIIFGFFLYLFLNSEVESNLATAHVTYKNIKSMLFPIILTLSIINIFVSSIIIGIFVLYASHKIAGPMYRFNEELKKFNDRNICNITPLRDGDQLYECSSSLINVAQVLRDDFSIIKGKMNELKNLCAKTKDNSKTSKTIKEIENIIDYYKL